MGPLMQVNITKISQVNREVTWFLRRLELSNYYIIKIYDLVGDAAIALTQDNPYWLLDEFPHMGFKRVDEIAAMLDISGADSRRIEAAVSFVMGAFVQEGHSYMPKRVLEQKCGEFLDIPSEYISDVLNDMTFGGQLQITALDGQTVVYFYGYYRAECHTAGKLAFLSDTNHKKLKSFTSNPLAFIKKYEDERGITLSKRQKDAVIGALTNGVTVITGGPGTGKTTIVDCLINVLEYSGHRVAVSAPTGRAAKRIVEAGGHFAQTVHRLLEYYYDERFKSMCFGRTGEDPLEYDCIIVDEASMMDIMLSEALTDAVREGTRLVFVGDQNQLPSVGAGNVLADMIKSEYFFTIELNEIYRQAGESTIVINAHRINRGEYPEFSKDADGDFMLIRMDKQNDIRNAIVKEASKYSLDEIQILSPTKKGIIGTQELNMKLQEVFNPASDHKDEISFGNRIIRTGDRVMQIKNDYQMEYRRERHDKYGGDGTEAGYHREDGRGIFNGEIGSVCGIDKDAKSVTVCFDDDRFGKNYGKRYAVYPYTKLDELEPAFAITVHKSQGSEYPVVIIPVSWFPPALATRSLIYTAITRAKQKVIIVGNPEYLNAMVDNDRSADRLSGLSSRLTALYNPI